MPEEPEDMWHAYNLIAAGDRLRAAAIRCAVSTAQVEMNMRKAKFGKLGLEGRPLNAAVTCDLNLGTLLELDIEFGRLLLVPK
jgi:hypothetical protein